MNGVKFSGTLFLVVGPSGSGKDSLINAARNELLKKGNFIFPKRFITRPTDSGEEKHIPVSQEEFSEKLQAGDFALSWEANGFRYGVSRSIEKELDEGCSVVLNVSRGVVSEALKKFASVKVVHVTAPQQVLLERLKRRGRESSEEIAKRMDRTSQYSIPSGQSFIIFNDGDLEEAKVRFLNFVSQDFQAHQKESNLRQPKEAFRKQATVEERQRWMSILAKSPLDEIEEVWGMVPNKKEYRILRGPETGLVMVRGRAGNTGLRFNLGELTVTRCAVETAGGATGLSYIAGRDSRKAELAAVIDGCLQDIDRRKELEQAVIAPLADAGKKRRRAVRQKVAPTKVDFFTMVRGEG